MPVSWFYDLSESKNEPKQQTLAIPWTIFNHPDMEAIEGQRRPMRAFSGRRPISLTVLQVQQQVCSEKRAETFVVS